ncbi:acylphosphatase-1-like isoform X1 [Rhopilema esculentum]|uniref:acylphosphatase-1-like isoform X1 n=1 Tax=Rhopilema esculentum TaxID=499914 RepID=UPI0031E21F9B
MAGSVTKVLKSVDFEVFGKVQGVFFRKHTHATATKFGLVGWVMNTKRHTVVGCMQGDTDRTTEMKTWLRTKGSPQSHITDCKFSNEKVIDKLEFKEFLIRCGKGD